MKKLESSLKNMLLVLTLVCAVATAILAYVNNLTTAPIAESAAKTLNEAIKEVAPEFDNNPSTEAQNVTTPAGEFVVYPASKGGVSVGAAVKSKTNGFGGDLEILVGFTTDGTINGYSILKTNETPGLGSKAGFWFKPAVAAKPTLIEKIFGFTVASTPRKSDITGKNPEKNNLTVHKDGGEIDEITASTITSRAFLLAVRNAYTAFKKNQK